MCDLSWELSFPRATIINMAENIFSHRLGGQKSEIKVSAMLVPSRDSKGETVSCLS